MAMVLKIFRTSLVAVPAFNRVEPVTISGPVGRSISTPTGTRIDRFGLQGQRLDDVAAGEGGAVTYPKTSFYGTL